MITPFLFGFISLVMGPDSYWDTRNYHIYNAYAFLNGRVGFDLAPAMMQSYFNPLLDVPYYLMAMHWPPRLVGFVMGTMHGLNFVLVFKIAQEVLQDVEKKR